MAREAVADAGVMRGHVTDRATVNRLYYACFHAAQAVLYDRGFDPDTHGGVVRLFGREVMQVGDASRSDAGFLSDMLERQSHADYKQEPLNVNVDSLYTRTEMFIEDMAELLDGGDDSEE